jgi:hypothetical protein
MRKVFVVTSWVVLVDVVLQFYFAGVGAFAIPQTEQSFGLHSLNSNFVMLLALVNAVVAALSRAGWRTALLAALPTVLALFQIVIFMIAGLFLPPDTTFDANGTPTEVHGLPLFVVAVHVLNGLAVLGVSVLVLLRARANASTIELGGLIEQRTAAP